MRDIRDLFRIRSRGETDRIRQASLSPHVGDLLEDAVVNGEEQFAGADRARGLASREDLLSDGNLGIAAQVLGERLHLVLQRVVRAVVDDALDQADRGRVAEDRALEVVKRQYLEHLSCPSLLSVVAVAT